MQQPPLRLFILLESLFFHVTAAHMAIHYWMLRPCSVLRYIRICLCKHNIVMYISYVVLLHRSGAGAPPISPSKQKQRKLRTLRPKEKNLNVLFVVCLYSVCSR
jgi:hypothetical protein